MKNVSGYPVSDPIHADSDRANFFVIGVGTPFVTSEFNSGAFFVGDSSNFTHSDNLLGRLDFFSNSGANVGVKYNIQLIDQTQGGEVSRTVNYPGSGIDAGGRNQNFSFNYVQQLSQRTVNELRFGWNRFRLSTLPLDHTLDPSSIFRNLNFTDKGFPSILIGGYDFFDGPYANLGAPFSAPDQRANNVWSFDDNIVRITGRHLIQAGVELRHIRLNVNNQAAGRGLVDCLSVHDAALSAGLNPQVSLASIARVSPQFGAVSGTGGFDRSFRTNSYDEFIQDTWHPRWNLSFNLGLRYEVNQAPVEERNRLVNNYPGACNQLVCLIRSGSDVIYDADGNVLGYSKFVAPRAGFKTDFSNLGPHLGIAWSPGTSGRTVLRAGGAITFDQQSLEPSVNMLLNPPFVQQTLAIGTSLSDMFPPGFLTKPVSFGASKWYPEPYSVTARDPNSRTPYVYQFHSGMGRQLGNRALMQAAYVFSGGQRLPRLRLLQQCNTLDLFFSDPDNCAPPPFSPGVPEPLPESVINQENSAYSFFNALQVSLETRNFHGLTVHLHYQWAHSIDDASSSRAPVFLLPPSTATNVLGIDTDQLAALNNANPTLSLQPSLPVIATPDLLPNDTLNFANVPGERASSDFDVRHRFVAYYIYDAPRWAWAGPVGSGWQLTGIITIQSGQPYSVFGDDFGVPLRPNPVGPTHINNKDADGSIDGGLPAGCNLVFNCAGTSATSSFDPNPPAVFEPGTLGRNTFAGPGLANFDFSLLKDTNLREGKKLRFRAEFFNLFNRANFRQPFSQIGQFASGVQQVYRFATPNPFFGRILQARPAREVQFALKFTF